jgi:hypothetical protein
MMNVMQAIEHTLPLASADKDIMPIDGEDTGAAEADNLATTMLEINRLISDVVAEKDVDAAPSDKGKRIEEASSKDKNFDIRHLGGQQFSEGTYQNLGSLPYLVATNPDPCSSVGSMKRFWDAFATASVLKS